MTKQIKAPLEGEQEKDNNNSGLVDEIVVTEAMVESGVVLLDDWLCNNLREMSEEGHTGYLKSDLVLSLLLLRD